MLITNARKNLHSDVKYEDKDQVIIRKLDNETIVFDKLRMILYNSGLPLLSHNKFPERFSETITIDTLPLIAGIRITDNCNLNCKYCFTQNNNGGFIDKDEFETIIKALRLLGIMVIDITGGEPTLHRNFNSLINLSLDYGYFVFLETNGLLLSNNSLGIFNNKNYSIRISLDSVDNATNSLTRAGNVTKIIHLIKDYVKAGVIISVRSVITKYNFSKLPEMAQILADIGLKKWILRRVIEPHENSYLSISLDEEKQMVEKIYMSLWKNNSQLQIKYRSQEVGGTNIIIHKPNIEELNLGLEKNDKEIIWNLLIPSKFSLLNHMNKYLRSSTNEYSLKAVLSENT